MIRPRLFTLVLVVPLAACGGAQTSPSAPSAANTPVTISGTVTDRISGVPIDGSVIQFRSPQLGSAAQATIVAGAYQVANLPPGSYEVTITGAAHLDHRRRSLVVSGNSNTASFTVLKWGATWNGLVYDQAFDAVYQQVAKAWPRTEAFAGADGRLRKWDPLPREIYVVQPTAPEISTEVFQIWLGLLEQVNTESIPAMFGGRIGPLPITIGPSIQSREGTIRVDLFFDLTVHSTAQVYGCSANVKLVKCAGASYNMVDLVTRGTAGRQLEFTKNNILHELYHVAFANHAYGVVPQDSTLMAGSNAVTQLRPNDVFISWLVYRPETMPGNEYPDTNP